MTECTVHKKSGVNWIGEVPSQWQIVRLKYLCEHISDKRTPAARDVKISPENVESHTGRVLSLRSDYESAGVIFCEGDILFNKLRVYLNKVLLSKWSGVSMGEMIVLRPRKVSSEYIYWVLTSQRFIDNTDSLSQGVKMPRPPVSGILNSFIPVPVKLEQSRISEFLNHNIAKIDLLTLKIQKKINLLNELRMTLISKFITKGLDPSVEMIDSGIEWVGEVPKHWKVKKLTYLVDEIGSGATPKSDNPQYYTNGAIPWLVTGELSDGRISESTKWVTGKALEDYSALKIWPKDSLVIAMYGATIGKLGLLQISTTVNQACCVCVVNEQNIPEYWMYAILASRKRILAMSYGGGQPNISQELMKSMRFASPPPDEQLQIARHLDLKTARIDSLNEKLECKKNLLREYRQTLISNVVTGKIRVTKEYQ